VSAIDDLRDAGLLPEEVTRWYEVRLFVPTAADANYLADAAINALAAVALEQNRAFRESEDERVRRGVKLSQAIDQLAAANAFLHEAYRRICEQRKIDQAAWPWLSFEEWLVALGASANRDLARRTGGTE
jgi:hypothetical protein